MLDREQLIQALLNIARNAAQALAATAATRSCCARARAAPTSASARCAHRLVASIAGRGQRTGRARRICAPHLLSAGDRARQRHRARTDGRAGARHAQRRHHRIRERAGTHVFTLLLPLGEARMNGAGTAGLARRRRRVDPLGAREGTAQRRHDRRAPSRPPSRRSMRCAREPRTCSSPTSACRATRASSC